MEVRSRRQAQLEAEPAASALAWLAVPTCPRTVMLHVVSTMGRGVLCNEMMYMTVFKDASETEHRRSTPSDPLNIHEAA